MVKNVSANAGDIKMLIRSLNGEDLPQEEMETPPVLLMGESNGQRSLWATVHGVTKS